MYCGNAIGAVRTCRSRDVPSAPGDRRPVPDNACTLGTLVVPGPARDDLFLQAAVDLQNDLEMTREHEFEPPGAATSPGLPEGEYGLCMRASAFVMSLGRLPTKAQRRPAECASVRERPVLGCVSLSWIATLSGRALPAAIASLGEVSATRSASEHATRKYSCTKRRPWPHAGGIVRDRARGVTVSAVRRSANALTKLTGAEPPEIK